MCQELCMTFSDLGLITDIVAVLILAKFSMPETILLPNGTVPYTLKVSEYTIKKNIEKYKLYRRYTIMAYLMLCVGFLLQLKLLH